jgi:hypothetical protein
LTCDGVFVHPMSLNGHPRFGTSDHKCKPYRQYFLCHAENISAGIYALKLYIGINPFDWIYSNIFVDINSGLGRAQDVSSF